MSTSTIYDKTYQALAELQEANSGNSKVDWLKVGLLHELLDEAFASQNLLLFVNEAELLNRLYAGEDTAMDFSPWPKGFKFKIE